MSLEQGKQLGFVVSDGVAVLPEVDSVIRQVGPENYFSPQITEVLIVLEERKILKGIPKNTNTFLIAMPGGWLFTAKYDRDDSSFTGPKEIKKNDLRGLNGSARSFAGVIIFSPPGKLDVAKQQIKELIPNMPRRSAVFIVEERGKEEKGLSKKDDYKRLFTGHKAKFTKIGIFTGILDNYVVVQARRAEAHIDLGRGVTHTFRDFRTKEIVRFNIHDEIYKMKEGLRLRGWNVVSDSELWEYLGECTSEEAALKYIRAAKGVEQARMGCSCRRLTSFNKDDSYQKLCDTHSHLSPDSQVGIEVLDNRLRTRSEGGNYVISNGIMVDPETGEILSGTERETKIVVIEGVSVEIYRDVDFVKAVSETNTKPSEPLATERRIEISERKQPDSWRNFIRNPENGIGCPECNEPLKVEHRGGNGHPSSTSVECINNHRSPAIVKSEKRIDELFRKGDLETLKKMIDTSPRADELRDRYFNH